MPLDHPAIFLLLPVLRRKVPRHAGYRGHRKELGGNDGPHAIDIFGFVLVAEDGGGIDAADGAKADLEGGANAALRVVADVVALVGENGGDVSVRARQAHTDPKVPWSRAGRIGREQQANDDEDILADNNGSAHTHTVCQGGEAESYKTCDHERWRREQLRQGWAETHPVQDLRQEVAERVRGGSRAHEH